MARYRGVSGVSRECVKRYRGVSGVSRQIQKGYRGVGGVGRQYFASNPVASGKIRLYSYTSSESGYDVEISDKSIRHWSGDGYTAKFILELYDSAGVPITFEKLSDIQGIDTVSWMVDTKMQVFSSVTIQDSVFGINPQNYETDDGVGFYAPEGWFTITKSNFTTKYITLYLRGSGQRDLTFGDLIINDEVVPITYEPIS